MSNESKTTIRYRLLKNHILTPPFHSTGWPLVRFYEEMTNLGPVTKPLFNPDHVFEVQLLPEHPEESEKTGNKQFDAALQQESIRTALENRARNSEIRMWRDRYLAAGIIALEETNA